MARKRAETAKRKIAKADNTSSVPKECLEVESNGNCKRNRSRLVTRSRAMKRDVKSGEEIACSEKVTENRDDSKVVPKRGPPKQERKRNASSLGRESPSKKIKLDSGETTTICGERKLRKRRVFVQEESGDNITQKSLVQEQQASAIKNQSKEKSPMKGKATPKNVNSPRQKEKLKAPPGSTPSPMKKRQTAGKKLKLNSYGLNNGESDAKPTTSHKTLSVDEGASSDSDSEGVAWEDVDEATVNHEIDDCDKDNPGTSSTKQHRSPSKKNVEISITVPGGKKKKGWSQEDVMKYIKRAINRFKKEVSTTVHKVHLLTLVGHGFFRNGVCNNRSLQAVVLSHVPNNFVTGNKRKWDVVQLTNFLKWFQSEFSSTEDIKTGDSETDQQISRVQNLCEIFVSVLRALGFLTRLVYSLQPVSAKADLEGRTSPKSLKKKTASQGNKTAKLKSTKKSEIGKRQEAPSRGKLIKTEIKTEKEVIEVGKNVKEENKESIVQGTGKRNSKKRKVTRTNEEQVDHKSHSSKQENMKKRRLRKRAKVEYSLSGNENGSDADEEWNAQSSDSEEETEGQKNSESEANFRKKDKTPLGRKKRTQNGSSSSLSFVDPMDDDSDFEVTSKPLMKKRVSGGGSKGKRSVAILSDDSDESVKCLGTENKDKGTDWWSEVYLPGDKKWICVHLESSSVNHPELCEQHATQPLVYVVSFDNNNAAKDVTNRYASCWMSKTRKLRLDPDWWEETLHPYKTRSKKMDQMEDSQLEGQLNDKPLPTSITEFKNHPLYVLKRHLLKFEAIYPESAVILGYCRGEAVYSRDCLHMLHTREKWLNEALVVKQGEKAYKVVKGRPKRNQPIHERDSVTIDLFGRWQTEDYKPPPAKDGKVPRNEYGNVELFKACMLPPGTSHIQIPGIQRVAKKLGIDCAQAVVGFDFHCGFSHPVIDGVVVCEEYESALLDAWREDEEEAERKKAEKREKRVLASWKLLTRSLLIKERLKKRYNTQEPEMSNKSTNEVGDDAVLPSTSVSWPLNRQDGRGSVASDGHCHVFLESGYKQDSVTGEWSKTCSCGLTLPFEKM